MFEDIMYQWFLLTGKYVTAVFLLNIAHRTHCTSETDKKVTKSFQKYTES